MNINTERLKNNLLELSKYGNKKEKGITRFPYTKEYNEALCFVERIMQK